MSAPGSRPKKRGSIGVSTGPGQMTLTRMSGARATAAARAKLTTPPLCMEYRGLNGDPTTPVTEAVRMTEALPPARRSSGTAYDVPKNTLFMLTSAERFQSSSVMSLPAAPGTPAWLCSTCRTRNSSSTKANIWRSCFRSVTSIRYGTALPPSSLTSLTVPSAAARSTSATTTVAPSLASR